MNFKNSRLKVAFYGEPGRVHNPLQCVAYQPYCKQIVFTGLHNGDDGPRGSTINFAEDIVAAISEQEGIDAQVYRYQFYDLQTCSGYGGEYHPGRYRFNELRPRWPRKHTLRPIGMDWIEGTPTSDVLDDFAEFIWGDSPIGVPHNLSVHAPQLQSRFRSLRAQ